MAKKVHLFRGNIDCNDVCQGQLGDCWLIAAIAAIAEHPGVINSLFLTREIDPRGKYKIRLYDGAHHEEEEEVLD